MENDSETTFQSVESYYSLGEVDYLKENLNKVNLSEYGFVWDKKHHFCHRVCHHNAYVC